MWRDRCLRVFNESNLNTKQIAEKCDVSENTIKRIKKYPDVTIQLATLEQIAKGFGLTLQDLTNDTNTIVGTVKLEVLQQEKDSLQADYDILITENNLLKTENSSLTARAELLEMKLMYTEKLLKVYEKFEK